MLHPSAIGGHNIHGQIRRYGASNVGAAVGRPSQPTKVQLGKCLPCMVVSRAMQGKRGHQSDWWVLTVAPVLGMGQFPLFVPDS